ncbi:terpene synthase family protein [Actinomycetes bacterium KLBMP 9759]
MTGTVATGAHQLPSFPTTLFPPVRSSHEQELQEHIESWLDEYRLADVPKVRARLPSIGEGVGACYPGVPRDLLLYIGEVFAWTTAFDDSFAFVAASRDMNGAVASLVAALEGVRPPGPASGFAYSMSYLVTRARQVMSPAHAARLVDALRGNLLAQVWETFADVGSLSVDEYVAVRPHATYATMMVALVEPGHRLHVPEEVRCGPSVQRLTAAANNIMGWCNDIASYGWEKAESAGPPLNLLSLVVRDDGCSEAEAFATASRMCDEQAAVAAAEIATLSSSPDADVRRFATCMGRLIAGMGYQVQLGRYAVAG